MASIDRLPVFMQHEILRLLKRAETEDADVNDVTASQFWVLRQAVDQVKYTKKEGWSLKLEGYWFHKMPRGKPKHERADLSDPTTDPTDEV